MLITADGCCCNAAQPFLLWDVGRSQPTESCGLKRKVDSHGQEPGGHGAEAIKQVAVKQTQEVVEEGGDGEDQRELLILFTAVWGGQRKMEAAELHGHAQGNHHKLLQPPPPSAWLTCAVLAAVATWKAGAQLAEITLRLQHEHQRREPKHDARKAETLQHPREQGEPVTQPGPGLAPLHGWQPQVMHSRRAESWNKDGAQLILTWKV